jgi:hypothetical protein
MQSVKSDALQFRRPYLTERSCKQVYPHFSKKLRIITFSELFMFAYNFAYLKSLYLTPRANRAF